MTKEHKKLYKAGKNWIVATLTATTITLLGGIGAYTVHADTTTEGTQSVQTASINQTSQSDNSDNTVTLNQPVTTQSNQNVQSAKSEQDIQASQSNQVTPAAVTEATVNDTNRLNPNIYGTVNVKDWDYQKGNNIINLTGYHGADLQHVIVPNLNDFNNANVDVNGVKNVDITSTVLKNVLGRLNSQNSTVAISKTDGSLNSKVVAEDNNWAATFAEGVKSKLEYADLTNLDTSKITNMAFLFDGQDHLKVLTGLDSWNTSNVISMKQMFQNDSELTALNLSNWDTSSATDMSFMFNMCNSARTFGDLSNWNTSNVTDMSGMFSVADSLQTVGNLDNWNTSNVTNMADMFNDTDNLQSIGNLSNWDTSKVTDMMGMFESTAKLQTVGDLSNWDTSKVTNMEEMFYFSHIQTAGDLGNWDTSNVTNMSYMFAGARELQTVGNLDNWDTSNVIDMSDMFNSVQLHSIGNLSKWNTSKVTNMSNMFAGAVNLQAVGDLSNWDTSKVTDMSDVLSDSKIDYFVVSRSDNSFINTLHLIDSNGLMGQPGETIAIIKAPTFYKLEPGKNENQSVYDTVLPLVQKKANEEYKNFLNGLTEGMRNIYPTKVSLKWVLNRGQSPTPADNANATFTYNMKIGTLKDFVINYVDKTGNVVGSEALTGTIGSTIPLPKKLSLPSGYQLVNGQNIPISVTVRKGRLQTIDIYVEKESKTPVVQTGSINYVDQDGKVVKTDQVSGKVGDKVDVKISLPDGYELANKDEQVPSTITVGDDGIKTININIKKIPVIKTGTINYIDPDGKVVKTDQVSGKVGDKVDVKLSLPDGYELANKDEQVPSTITVGDDGIKTININIKKIPVTKTGTINYIDPDGKVVKTDQVSGKVGDKVDVKLSLPDGYELANKDEQVPSTITIGDDGIKTININIKKIPVIKTGTINYIDPDGKVVKTDQVSGKVGDKVDVKLSLPDGYELANKDEQVPSVITVTENGIGTINVNVKKINTTLANNEVPYDSTTVSNNENANYGYLDSYKLTENNQGQAQLIASGWHATGASNSDRYRYMIVFDNTLGHEIARQKLVPQVRSDVQRAYPNVDNSLYSGFNITIDIPNSSINHSLSLIARYSNDPNNGEGARVDYWFNPLALNEGNQAYLDGLSSNGNTLTVTGWHATNQAAGRPYHYIIAWDQNLGHEIARQKVTAVSRPDVANAYSTVANAVNSGFSVRFNLTPQFFNDNIQFISRWTDDAAGNGNAVDYWFKPMNRTNRANLDSVTLSNGQVKVAGWHATDLSQLEPNHYLIVFDNTTGQQVASEKVGLQSSQDVKNVFGDVQTANHSRFNYAFNSLHLISGHNYSLVSRYSADANGNGNDGAHTDSWLNMGTFQQSAYSIDHVALNRRHMTVQGWVANDNAMTRPYAYAILLQNGHEIGRQRLNLSERADVAKVYPQIYRSQYSGFNTSFDLPTASTNGLQLVLRFTDDPAGNGNSSDKWINL